MPCMSLSLKVGMESQLLKNKNYLIITLLILISCKTTSNRNLSIDSSTENIVEIDKNIPDPKGLRHFMDGQLLMNQGDFAMAIIEFQQALALDPNVSAIHTAIAESYWNLGKPKLSEDHLLQAIKNDPTDKQALQMISDQYILEKKYSEATNYLQKLNILYPDEPRYIIALAELKKINQKYKEAIELYLKAYSFDSSRNELLETAGRLSLQINDEEKAKEIFKKLAKINLDESRYLSIYIDLLSRSESFQEGIEFIETLNKQYGETSDRKAQFALLLFRSGKKEESIILLEALVNDSPNNPNYYFSLFDIYMEQNQIVKASILGDKLITNFPEDWRGYYSRSLVFMSENDNQSVISLLEPVSTTFKKVFSIQYLLGLSNYQIKEYKETEKYFVNALKIRPDSKNVLHSMAILYDEIDQFDKSDSIYIKLISIDNKDAQAFNNYAYSLVEREMQLKKALDLASKAIELEPNNSSYLDTIGWIYFKQKNFKKAQYYIQKSLDLNKTNAVVLEHLGDVMIKVDRLSEAKDLYRRALLLDKSNQRLKLKVSSE
jgi:tetratricopeptide (TPR) repeat protein